MTRLFSPRLPTGFEGNTSSRRVRVHPGYRILELFECFAAQQQCRTGHRTHAAYPQNLELMPLKELVLTAQPMSPTKTLSAATEKEDQSDFWTMSPNSGIKAAESSGSASVTSMVNGCERGSTATSVTRLSSTTSLGLSEAVGGSRTALSRGLVPDELRLSQVEHFHVEELVNTRSASPSPSDKTAPSRARSFDGDGERRSLVRTRSESEAAGRLSFDYGSMIDGGGNEVKIKSGYTQPLQSGTSSYRQ